LVISGTRVCQFFFVLSGARAAVRDQSDPGFYGLSRWLAFAGF